jgi:hypothetical protein
MWKCTSNRHLWEITIGGIFLAIDDAKQLYIRMDVDIVAIVLIGLFVFNCAAVLRHSLKREFYM